MLFILTGDVQTGKTRWLTALIDELTNASVTCFGVLAPGVWGEKRLCPMPDSADAVRTDHSVVTPDCAPLAACVSPGESKKESSEIVRQKLGIDNVLLPAGERITFAQRRDLVEDCGESVRESQSASAKLSWAIADEAIARVNAHFDEIALANASHTTHFQGLLVVDELGRLELMHDRGLTSALALISSGPTENYAHALIVVRSWLADAAVERFSSDWSDVALIAAGSEARQTIRNLYRL